MIFERINRLNPSVIADGFFYAQPLAAGENFLRAASGEKSLAGENFLRAQRAAKNCRRANSLRAQRAVKNRRWAKPLARAAGGEESPTGETFGARSGR